MLEVSKLRSVAFACAKTRDAGFVRHSVYAFWRAIITHPSITPLSVPYDDNISPKRNGLPP